MNKKELLDDFKFREKCGKYGLYWENAEIYGNVILINTPIEGLYVIFDKNYNTIGIQKNSYKNEEQFAYDYYEGYSKFTDIMPFGENFDYPFENYTLKNFIDLANKVDIIECNHGHSIITKINEKWYDRDTKENEEYFQLLSYIKFISEEIKEYFLINYHMQVMGLEVPDIYAYVRALIKNITSSVYYQIKNNQRPWPINILNSIGQNDENLNFNLMLFDIADLLMKQKGVKVKSGSFDTLEQIDISINKKDLSVLSEKLLKILDLSDEELKEKGKNQEELIQNQNIPCFNVDNNETIENGPVLKKVNNK